MLDSKVFLSVSLAANQHLISVVGPKERIQDNLNLKTRSRLRKATEDAGIFGHAVWVRGDMSELKIAYSCFCFC